MHHIRKILVGVDLSHADRLAASELNPPTTEAIRRAVWLAGRLKSELTFFSAIDLSAHTQKLIHEALPHRPHNLEDDAQAVLADLVSQAKQEGVAANSKLVFGRSWLELIRHAVQEKSDLVVVGTRDLGVAGRILLGSTGIKLLRNCPCPVWVTKPDPNWDDLNILVASDLGTVSQEAIETAVGCGHLTEAKIHLFHAVESQYDQSMILTGLTKEGLEQYRNKERQEAESKLHDQLSQTDHRTLKQGVQIHVEDGPADTLILSAIEKFGIDLLVMGTVARSGIPGLLVGNTAERLLPHIPCSVLALKPEGFKCGIDLE